MQFSSTKPYAQVPILSVSLLDSQELCKSAAEEIQMRSQLIQDAVFELIELLLGPSEFEGEEDEEEDEFQLPPTSALLRRRGV